jgi:hypothetical protein
VIARANGPEDCPHVAALWLRVWFRRYKKVGGALRQLEVARDALAGQIKGELTAAAFDDTPIADASAQVSSCQGLIKSAQQLAGSS